MKMTIGGRVFAIELFYEPLGTIGVARAMCLVSVKRCSSKNTRGARAAFCERRFKVPSVVRLRAYVNVRRRRKRQA